MRDFIDRAPPSRASVSDSAGDNGAPLMLGGRYRLDSLIAEGGMAAVWRAHDEMLARFVALKVLHHHLVTDDEFVERFRREAVAAAKLTHPHVVSIYDTGRDGRRVWLVMELVEGMTLRQAMDERGPLDVEYAAGVGAKIARGLAFAHQHGLVHRDVKPANILLGEDGTVKVTDFGIAKAAGATNDLTGTGMVLGTAAYVAPEQIRSEPLDGASDQYSLGCVLYEALSGRRAFTGDTPMATAAQRLTTDPPPVCSVRSDVPAGLGAVVDRCLSRDPAGRFPSAADLADALAAFAPRDSTGPFPAPPPPHPPPNPGVPRARPPGRQSTDRHPPRQPATRRRVGPLVAVGLAVALLVTAIGTSLLDRDPGEAPGAGTPQGSTGLVAPAEVVLFDPAGSGSEDGADLLLLLDGDPSTTWQSVGYNTPDFGGLKPGLGFWLDLGTPHAVDRVALRTDTPGINYEIRAADEPATRLDGWRLVGSQSDAGALSEVAPDEPAVGRYLLIWITGDLQPDGSGRFRVRLSEVAVSGQPV